MSLDIYLRSEDLDGNFHTSFHTNITHNLGLMASRCGIYKAMWRPEENGWERARDIIPSLEEGVERLRSNEEFYSTFNPKNNWGSYEGLLEIATEYLEACKKFPSAFIFVSR